MLFMTYWELNPNYSPAEFADIAQTLVSKKIFAEGPKQICSYVSTAGTWGVTIEEAENEKQLVISANQWKIIKPGIFKHFETTNAIETTKILPLLMRLNPW